MIVPTDKGLDAGGAEPMVAIGRIQQQINIDIAMGHFTV